MKTFTERIYEKLKQVPHGYVTTYGELARSIKTRAFRAVGTAMKKNKDPLNIHCYRVVSSNGFVGQYSAHGGIKKKIELLKKEGIDMRGKKISPLKKYLYKFNARTERKQKGHTIRKRISRE